MRKFLFGIISFLSLCASIYFSFFIQESSSAMTGLWLTFSLFTFAFGWPDVAESISFLGSNIKLREVRNTICELRQLAEVNSRVLLELMQCSNRAGGISEDEKIDEKKDNEDYVKNVDIEDINVLLNEKLIPSDEVQHRSSLTILDKQGEAITARKKLFNHNKEKKDEESDDDNNEMMDENKNEKSDNDSNEMMDENKNEKSDNKTNEKRVGNKNEKSDNKTNGKIDGKKVKKANEQVMRRNQPRRRTTR
jgi:hypothetical protein